MAYYYLDLDTGSSSQRTIKMSWDLLYFFYRYVYVITYIYLYLQPFNYDYSI